MPCNITVRQFPGELTNQTSVIIHHRIRQCLNKANGDFFGVNYMNPETK